jgi:hypothetical protein
LLGDGMLTIDGGYHKRARRDHAARVPPRPALAPTTETMVRETERARSTAGPPRSEVDCLPLTTRALGPADRHALPCSASIPPAATADFDIAEEFDGARSRTTGADYFLQKPARARDRPGSACTARGRFWTG